MEVPAEAVEVEVEVWALTEDGDRAVIPPQVTALYTN
jgi:hypothetical protein